MNQAKKTNPENVSAGEEILPDENALKEYFEGKSSTEEVMQDLASSDRMLLISALTYIQTHPDESYLSRLATLERQIMDPFVLSAWVKSLAAVAGEKSLSRISRYLKHEDDRVRANCIEAITLSGVSPVQNNVLRVLLNFLSDPSKRVVTNCLRALKGTLTESQLQEAVNDYFNSQDELSCLNCLFLIYQLGLTGNTYIFEFCLSHPAKRVRDYAGKLLPLFEKKHPDVRKLLNRRVRDKGDSTGEEGKATLDGLGVGAVLHDSTPISLMNVRKIMEGEETRPKLDLLLDLGKEGFADPSLLKYLEDSVRFDLEPFVLATLVKTVAQLETRRGWELLHPILKHGDGRVVSNTVEALVLLKDERVLDFLREVLDRNDLNDRDNCRIVTSGLNFLRERAPDLAFEAMDELASGNITCVSAFIRFLKDFKESSAALIPTVLRLVDSEIRPDVLFESANFLYRHGNEAVYNRIEGLIHQVEVGEKKEILLRLKGKLEKKLKIKSKGEHSRSVKQIASLVQASKGKSMQAARVVHSGLQEKLSQATGKKPLDPYENLFLEESGPIYLRFIKSPWVWFCLFTGLSFYLGKLLLEIFAKV